MDQSAPIHEIDPTVLAKFGRLELLARLVVEGVLSGRHPSPFKGFSVEFAEHRPYGPGDEIRHIDWRAFGKSDRYYVREYEEHTNLNAYLVLDTSGSMGYAGASISKLEHARRLAAAIAYLMIKQRDAVGLVTSSDQPGGMIPARTAPDHFSVLCRAMETSAANGSVPLHRLLQTLASRLRRRSFLVVLSDAFDELGPLQNALRHLRHRHHELLLLHVVAQEEEAFEFSKPAIFRDLEGERDKLRVDPVVLKKTYLERFEAHADGIREALWSLSADYHRASTMESTDRILLDYLGTRSSRFGRGVNR